MGVVDSEDEQEDETDIKKKEIVNNLNDKIPENLKILNKSSYSYDD